VSMENMPTNPPPLSPPPTVPRWASWLARLALMGALLAGGTWICWYWLAHRPVSQRKRPERRATLVEVSQVAPVTRRVVVRAMGTVVPAREIQLAAQVGGRVVDVNAALTPGGRFQAGQRILQIDPGDYQLAVRQRSCDLVCAQSEQTVEAGRQSVARREYELLGQDVSESDKELLLRRPQLAMAGAAVEEAEAALEQAKLNLERTVVTAPFNAIVQSRGVDVGSHVNPGAALASMVGTDEYWVRVSVPAHQLRWIELAGADGQGGSPVRVSWESGWGLGVSRRGVAQRLMTNLETAGRMAQVLVAVRDPLELALAPDRRHPLVLDSYVRVEIEGREVEGVVVVPRTALRDGGKVWVMAGGSKLDIRDVTIAWSGAEEVYASRGLNAGEKLIVSDLGAPVQGMAIRTAAAGAAPVNALAGGADAQPEAGTPVGPDGPEAGSGDRP